MPTIPHAFAALLAQLLAMNPTIHLSTHGTELTQLQCLTSAVYYEMRDRNEAVQIGVAYTVKNRVRQNKYPNDYCKVIVQPSQYRDNWRAQRPNPNWRPAWTYAAKVALSVHYGLVDDPTQGATHFCMSNELNASSPRTRSAVSWCRTDGVWLQDVKFVNPSRDITLQPYVTAPPSRHPHMRKTIDQIAAALS